LVVIGAGYIGLELGSVWSRLGARTTCVEILDRILPATDVELAAELQSLLEQQELAFRLGTRVTQLDAQEGRVELRLSPAEGDVESDEKLECSHVLVAVGRRPCTEGLGLEQAGVETDERGFIRIDERFRTTLEGTFAIGDVAREPMLAHKAQDEALACVEAIAGRGSGRVHYEAIPSIVYTSPEVASVGRSEDELREQEVEFRKGRSSFRHNSRARCTAETDGFVKILADPESDRILGAHLIGPQAGTLIHEIVTAMEFGACAEELGRTCHGHPTLNEAVREAALAVHGRPIHG
jgi:dihydrolipoamide dehydrogenase